MRGQTPKGRSLCSPAKTRPLLRFALSSVGEFQSGKAMSVTALRASSPWPPQTKAIRRNLPREWWPSWAGWGCSQATVSRRSEEHTSELQSLMRISYAVFCLQKKQSSMHTIRLGHDHGRHSMHTQLYLDNTSIQSQSVLPSNI